MSKITETTKDKTRESTYMIGDVVVKKNINKMKKNTDSTRFNQYVISS